MPLTASQPSRQLPSGLVAREFGEVNVRESPHGVDVNFTILMEPSGELSEGWQSGVALDASASMKALFGKGLRGRVPEAVIADYLRRGWVVECEQDGRRVQRYQPEAHEDAIRRGYLVRTENVVESLARQFISYLADNLD